MFFTWINGGFFMYDEKKLKFWSTVEIIKKWGIVLAFSVVGLVIGFLVSEFVVDVLNEIAVYRIAFIGGLTFLGFFVGLLLTSSTERNVQDAYWKIAVMKSLEEINETLDNLKKENTSSVSIESKFNDITNEVHTMQGIQETEKIEEIQETENTEEVQENNQESVEVNQ